MTRRSQPFSALACIAIATVISLPPAIRAQEERLATPGLDRNVSLKLEIERAIEKGVKWLEQDQDAETGSWSDPIHPALTALPVMAIVGDPNRDPKAPLPVSATRGFDYLTSKQKDDGGIYGKGLATYNTALSVTALTLSGNKEHLPVIAKARRLLVNLQQDFDKRGENDNIFDGGIGYGGSYAHSDLSNTHLALEALYYSKQVLSDTEFDETSEFDLDWEGAIAFISRCQNGEAAIEAHQGKVGVRDEDRGGFIYFPGATKSDVIDLPDGRVALRSYGSMSYAGLLSFIYANLDEKDPRVVSVMEWLRNNYTLEENPGMDAQGLFYYYHTLAKALSLTRTGKLETADGKQVDWREDLALKLMGAQGEDGSWINEGSNRWMEDDRSMVTAYSLLALEHIYRGL